MMHVEMNSDRLHLLSINDFDCRQLKSAPLVRIDSRGLSEKTADRSVTVTNSNKLLTGRALFRLNCGVANRTFGRKTICMTTTEWSKRKFVRAKKLPSRNEKIAFILLLLKKLSKIAVKTFSLFDL